MDLSDIGIRRGVLCECIVTTFHEDGSSNAAPMGVRGMDESRFEMRVHTDTDTYENLVKEKSCAVNIIHDPLIFLKCALQGHNKGPSETESVSFKPAVHVNAPYLSGADAYVEAHMDGLEVVQMVDSLGSAKIARAGFKAENITVMKPYPLAPNRGFFAGLELAIALSRGKKREAQRYLDIIEKTLPPEDFEVVKDFLSGYAGSIP